MLNGLLYINKSKLREPWGKKKYCQYYKFSAKQWKFEENKYCDQGKIIGKREVYNKSNIKKWSYSHTKRMEAHRLPKKKLCGMHIE